MIKSINDILKEADAVIEKTASVKTASKIIDSDDDITSLALELEKAGLSVGLEKQAAAQSDDETAFEKVAHAIAILEAVDSINNEEKLSKVAQAALEKGFTTEQVEAFVQEKRAEYVALHQSVVIPEGLNA